MVGNHDADVAFFQETDDLLDVEHRDRVDTRKRLVEQYEPWSGRQGAGDFDSPPLAAGQADGGRVAKMRDRQVFEERVEAIGDLVAIDSLKLEDGLDILGHGKLPEYRRLLRQVR